MTRSIKVKIQQINAEAFKPYGELVNKSPVFPEVEPGQGRVAIEVKHVRPRPETKQMRQLNIHFSYNQTFMPLQGSMVIVVAPPPRNPEAPEAEYEFDADRVAGFIFHPGQVVHIDKGVWHGAFMLGTQCTIVNVTRKDPGEGTTMDAEGQGEVTHSRRPYIDFVDLTKRDGLVLDLDLSGIQDSVRGVPDLIAG